MLVTHCHSFVTVVGLETIMLGKPAKNRVHNQQKMWTQWGFDRDVMGPAQRNVRTCWIVLAKLENGVHLCRSFCCADLCRGALVETLREIVKSVVEKCVVSSYFSLNIYIYMYIYIYDQN